ncbi:ABC transporter substrate-binding protein [Diaphorobacter sp.]|uniref:ABC transporter substrate-binding protein n=1 Tax=Diaphorobacter sp. TaxID=1934310 RepID=UPI00289AE92C|nr:ABC transporter substrate-binding protein [Diaphorobacter sp.]
MRNMALALVLQALAAIFLVANAQTIRVANQGDALSMDPHALNESLQLSLTGNVYEPLVGRNKDLSLVPALALAWRATTPTVWRFELRRGVSFHDGALFTADDAVFSLRRAQSDGSDMRSYLSGVREVRKLDAHTIEIETREPTPLLPALLSHVYMMSQRWSEAQGIAQVGEARGAAGQAAALRANGTGPFRLAERRPQQRTVFERNTRYWGTIESNARQIVFLPIPDNEARVAALLAGRVDVMEPVPVQDIERVSAAGLVRVVTGPELRTLFLGMDQHSDELPYASVRGANPFKDRRVRQAFYQAIDIDALIKNVMRGAATPAALIVGPGVNGFQPDVKRLPHDVAAARALMAQAGYGEGFALTLDCPSDRYVNDAALCTAIAAQLATLQVRVTVRAEPKAQYYPRILRRDAGFYLMGWTPSTYDAHGALNALAACPRGEGAGHFNLGGYCNPRLDALLLQVQTQTDKTRRDALLREALLLQAADIAYIPLHQQALAWGVSKKIRLVQMADNTMPFKWMGVGP